MLHATKKGKKHQTWQRAGGQVRLDRVMSHKQRLPGLTDRTSILTPGCSSNSKISTGKRSVRSTLVMTLSVCPKVHDLQLPCARFFWVVGGCRQMQGFGFKSTQLLGEAGWRTLSSWGSVEQSMRRDPLQLVNDESMPQQPQWWVCHHPDRAGDQWFSVMGDECRSHRNDMEGAMSHRPAVQRSLPLARASSRSCRCSRVAPGRPALTGLAGPCCGASSPAPAIGE